MKSITSSAVALVAFALSVFSLNVRGQSTPSVAPLYSFSAFSGPFVNVDGGEPECTLLEGTDGNLYGTTSEGGSSDGGTIFRITPAGEFATLHTFTNYEHPEAGLTQGSDGNFYGTAPQGGNKGYGTFFRMSPAGVVTNLHSFDSFAVGIGPQATLIRSSDGNFYGTTGAGGSTGSGTVFSITSAGQLTTVYDFEVSASDGLTQDPVIQGRDGNFYGATYYGGSSNSGSVYRLTAAGVYTTLYSFSATDQNRHNNDGAYPAGGLVQGSDGNLYGVTTQGGTGGSGAIFRITPAGAFTVLHRFAAIDQNGVNEDGSFLSAAPVQGSDGNFYGTTGGGGSSANGTIFRLTPSGVLTTLYNFTATDENGVNVDGAGPNGLIQGSDGMFYGTAIAGGSGGNGTIFKLGYFPTITSAATATGIVGQTFSYRIRGTNDPTSYAASGLPAGLTIDKATGLISGTPTTAGTFAVTVAAYNPLGKGSARVTLTISAVVPDITSPTTATAAVGKAFSYQITATHSPTSYAASGLPPGLSINTQTGLISGTPTREDAFTVILHASNQYAEGTGPLNITVRGPLVITSSASAPATQGEAFSYQITANGSVNKYTARGLPTGLTIDASTGLITGKPFNSGKAAVEISAGNANAIAFARLTITIKPSLPVFTSPNTTAATQDQPFFYRLTATNAPASFSARSLPTGLTLDTKTGDITGTPINSGVAAVRVSATNAAGTTSMRLTFTIASYVPVVTSATTATATVGQAFSYQITATHSPTRYTATGLPTGLFIDPSTGRITGTPQNAGTAVITVSASNKAGTATARLTITVTSN